jgi:26S proteasome regulatory subunit N10
LISESKFEKNPENGLGVISMAGKRVEVNVSLTNDLSMILNSIKAIQLSGESDIITSLNIATLTLKHRPNKNQKQRIVLFVGSPIKHSVEEMVQSGKKLKKYNIAVDIISFGNIEENKEHINQFLNAVNNGGNSSLTEVPVGFFIMDALFTSPIMNEGGGMEFDGMVNDGGLNNAPVNNTNNQPGMNISPLDRDINEAIQQSLEDERKRAEAARNSQTSKPVEADNVEMKPAEDEQENEEEELEKARLLSMQEHTAVIKNIEEEESKQKEEILENPDFIKDILQGIDETDINDEEVHDLINKMKTEKEKKDDQKKDNK